jgi:hypothetical protein
MNRDDLIAEYRAALYEQLDAKRAMLAAQQAYEMARARVYLTAKAEKETHYTVQHLIALDPDVILVREQLNEAKLRHYEAWINSRILHKMLGGHDPDEWLNNDVNDGND